MILQPGWKNKRKESITMLKQKYMENCSSKGHVGNLATCKELPGAIWNGLFWMAEVVNKPWQSSLWRKQKANFPLLFMTSCTSQYSDMFYITIKKGWGIPSQWARYSQQVNLHQSSGFFPAHQLFSDKRWWLCKACKPTPSSAIRTAGRRPKQSQKCLNRQEDLCSVHSEYSIWFKGPQAET